MKISMRTTSTAIVLALTCLSHSAANAQELNLTPEDEWYFSAAPYIWFAGMDGELTVRGLDADIDVGFDDILDVLKLGAIGHFEAKKNQWSLMADLVFLSIEDDADTPGRLVSKIEAGMDTWIVELGAAYDFPAKPFAKNPNRMRSFSLLGGLRYTSLEMKLDFDSFLSISDIERHRDWVDPYVGFRGNIRWSEKWTSSFRADVGGFGVGSDFVYQLRFNQILKLNEKTDFVFGYRHLDYDYEDGSGRNQFRFDASMSGPLVGLNFRF